MRFTFIGYKHNEPPNDLVWIARTFFSREHFKQEVKKTRANITHEYIKNERMVIDGYEFGYDYTLHEAKETDPLFNLPLLLRTIHTIDLKTEYVANHPKLVKTVLHLCDTPT